MINHLDLIDQITYLSRMLRRHPADGEHRSHGSQRVLAVLMEEDGLRASDLAQHLDIRPSSLVEVVKHLQEEKYVKRVRDEKDSRVYRIYMTEKARDHFEQRQYQRSSWRGGLNTCLTEEELIIFSTLCDKIGTFLELEQREHPNNDYHCKKDYRDNHHHGKIGGMH